MWTHSDLMSSASAFDHTNSIQEACQPVIIRFIGNIKPLCCATQNLSTFPRDRLLYKAASCINHKPGKKQSVVAMILLNPWALEKE